MSAKKRFKLSLLVGGLVWAWSHNGITAPPAEASGGADSDGAVRPTTSQIQSEIDALTAKANADLLAQLRGQVEAYLLGATELLRWREHLQPLAPLGPGFRKGDDVKIGHFIELEKTSGSNQAVAFWAADIPTEGIHQIELRRGDVEPRAVLLFINDALVAQYAMSKAPSDSNWSIEGVFHFRSGSNALRFETMDRRPLPGIERIVLIPTTVALKPVAATTAPLKPAHVIARERGLIREVLENWTDYLAATDTGDHPVFAAWHELRAVPDDELACCAESVVRDYAGLGPDGTSLLTPLVEKGLIGFAPSSMAQVAWKYGPMFAEADRAWQAFRQTAAGRNADGLPDAQLEPFRKVLSDPAGPFALPVHPEAFYPPTTLDRLNQLRAAIGAPPIKRSDTATRP